MAAVTRYTQTTWAGVGKGGGGTGSALAESVTSIGKKVFLEIEAAQRQISKPSLSTPYKKNKPRRGLRLLLLVSF